MRFGICVFILFEIFYFSEGKPCPEKTRPHKTRCEAFYKCTELPTKRLVWVPEKCESGLIYEHNLGLCVLPDDDWECTLGANTPDERVHLGAPVEGKLQITQKHQEIEVVAESNISSEEEVKHDESRIESSGDGASELVELDGFLQAENRETEDAFEKQPADEEDTNEIPPETVTRKSKIDPKLTAQLQRLSQLIDGLKDQYKQDDTEQKDLRPDQLNAFLAHFNIQNKYNLIEPTLETTKEMPQSSSTTKATESTTSKHIHQLSNSSNMHLQEHFDKKLKPETKVVLTNTPKYYAPTGYSNSQIVVNRPEGSVLFALPHYANNEQLSQYAHNNPKVSEDTLNTVLELSKQMIATQNIPKVVPNPEYYARPLIQPLFLPASAFQTQAQGNPFTTYFSSTNNGQQQQNYEGNASKYNPYAGSYSNLSGHTQLLRPASSYNKPGTTIIHNNVIPVHVTATNSGEKEIVDSYGQSLGLFPPLNTDAGNSYHQHYYLGDNKYHSSAQISTTPRPKYAGQYNLQFPTELGATTIRPTDFQPTSPTLQKYFSPSPHLDDNNVNKLFEQNDRYPTVQYDELPRPFSQERPTLFTPHTNMNKVKVRPNGHKGESMEMDADEYGDNYARPLSQLYYDSNKHDATVNHEYQEPSYVSSSSSSSSNTGNQHTYMPRPSSVVGSTFDPSYTSTANKVKPYNTHLSSSFSDGTQLVNVGGNFVSFDVFQNTILPLVGQSQSLNDLHNIEVITCTTGVRQPNITDCMRYYVCSKKDGKVLSYSCPPYTAFNAQSRICDAHTYSICSPDAIMSSYTVTENKRLQMEAIQVLQDAKRRQDQAIKAQNIASLIQKYGSQTQGVPAVDEDIAQQDDSNEKDMLNTYVQQAAAMSVYNTTPRPTAASPAKKRKYYCKEGDKIADQTSMHSYFVCYKNAQGMMKGHKLTCTNGLVFCSKTSMCTLQSKCT